LAIGERYRRLWETIDSSTFKLLESLEKIASELNREKSSSGDSITYDWKLKRKKLFETIISLGRIGYPELEKMKFDALKIFDLWIKYWESTFVSYGLTTEDIDNACRILKTFHESNIYPKGFFTWNPWFDDFGVGLIKENLGDIANLKELIFALNVGYRVYNTMFSRFILELLSVVLPTVDYQHRKKYFNEAKKSLSLLKLRDLWYYFVEVREKPNEDYWLWWEDTIDTLINL